MPDITFVDNSLVAANRITAAWLNPVNRLVNDLPDTGSAAKNAGLVPFVYGLSYALSTIGFTAKHVRTRSVFDVGGFTAAQVADVQAGTKLVDVSTPLQTALTAAGAGGFGLFLPPGQYRCSSVLTVTDIPYLAGVRGKSILCPNGISGTVFLTLKSSLNGAGVQLATLIEDISISGTDAGTGKTGISVEGVSTNPGGRIVLRGVECNTFTGANAVGVSIERIVEATIDECLLGFSYVNLLLDPDVQAYPTTITVRKSNIRQATTAGVLVTSGANIYLLNNIIESNTQEGLKVVVNAGPEFLVGLYSEDNHYENNWAGGASSYQINIVGDTTALTKRFYSIRDFFDHNTASIGCISMNKVRDFVIDGPNFGSVPTGVVNAASGSTGSVVNWPLVIAPVTSTLINVDATSTVDFKDSLYGSATYNPANLVDGDGVTTTVAVTNSLMGAQCQASFSNALQGILLTAWVSAAGTVSVRFQNETGGAIDLASGTLKVKVSVM